MALAPDVCMLCAGVPFPADLANRPKGLACEESDNSPSSPPVTPQCGISDSANS